MWNDLNSQYEDAYGHNPLKRDCVEAAIRLLKPRSRVLDVGCGTGAPVAQMLSDGGMEVFGCDVAPEMVQAARSKVKGTFEVADMVNYQPEGSFDAIFIIYSHLGLKYGDFHRAIYRLAKTLCPNGLLVIGQAPADKVVPAESPEWDSTCSYVEDFNLPFWGQPFPTLMLTRAAQKAFLETMGLEVVYDEVGEFQPNNPKCDLEYQQYIIGRRWADTGISEPYPQAPDNE